MKLTDSAILARRATRGLHLPRGRQAAPPRASLPPVRVVRLGLGLCVAVAACAPGAARPADVTRSTQPLCLAVQWRAESLGVRHAGAPAFRAAPDLGQVVGADTLLLLRTPPARPPRRPGEYFSVQPLPEGLAPYAYWRWEGDSLAIYLGDMTGGSRWELGMAGDSVHGWGTTARDDGGHWLLRGDGRLRACAVPGQPTSPLATAWSRDAMLLGPAEEVLITDSVAAAARAVALPSAAIPELRSLNPTVGLEDSTRALYRVTLAEGATGYVIRIPSTEGPYPALAVQYASGRWERPVMLAQAYGDAGFSWIGRSWLLDLDRDGAVEVVSRWRISDTDLDAPGQPTVTTDSLAVMRVEGESLRVRVVPPGDALRERFRLDARP